MAYSRFTLNTSELDDATVGLDGSPFPMQATGASSLGGLSANASATITKLASGSSSLGGISASASAQSTIFPVLSSSLGGLDGLATAQSEIFPRLSASLGGLDATAQASSTLFPILSSSLGGLDATAQASSTLFPVLSSSLGGLSATASASAIIFPVFDAPLDGMVASATATINPPEPPEIPPSGSRWWKQPAAPVTKHEPPEQIVIEIPKPRRPLLVSVVAVARLGGADVGALGSVTFSTLDDDAEVLLLV
jgi:hypothetical protein